MVTSHPPAIAVGIDIGTSGVRAVVLSAEGEPLGFSAFAFPSIAETRQPAVWWQGVRHCLTDLAAAIPLQSVEGIAVDGTSGTVLSLDENGQPLGDVLMYNDPCPDPDIVRRIEAVAPASSAARGANSGLARGIHLSKDKAARHIVHQADWILMQLGVKTPVTDENNALKSGYDLKDEIWPDWIEAAGMDRAMLPGVVRAGAVLGPLGAAARAFGLPENCRYHAGTTDGCASFLATGAAHIGDGVTALGSTMVLKLACDRPIDAPEFGIYAHRVLDFWLVGGASNTGGNVIRALVGDDNLEALTARLDPGRPTGLDYYPLLKPGERFPVNDPAWPPRLEPRPDDDAVFFQGILEGMTEIERLGFERLQALGAPKLRSLRTVGGGARNPVWSAMRQAALGVPFAVARSTEACVGAASLVLAGRSTP